MPKLFAAVIVMALPLAVAATPRPATPKELAAIKAAMQEKLKDPDSARLRSVMVDPDKGMACGLINAKNAFGGYVGFHPFNAVVMILPKAEPFAQALGIDTDDDHVAAQMCAESGMPVQ